MTTRDTMTVRSSGILYHTLGRKHLTGQGQNRTERMEKKGKQITSQVHVCTGEVVYIRTAYEKASENDCQALGAARTSLGTPVIRRSRSESSCIGEKKKLANHIVCLARARGPTCTPFGVC